MNKANTNTLKIQLLDQDHIYKYLKYQSQKQEKQLQVSAIAKDFSQVQVQ